MGLSLYHLSGEYQQLLDLAAQAGTEEDTKAFDDTLAGLTGAIEERADACAAAMATMQAEADALDNEAARLKARSAAILSNRKRLSEYVIRCLKLAHLEKVRGKRFTVSWRLNPPRVVVDDEALIPESYWHMQRVLAKDHLNSALKTGQAVPGCHIERGESLRCQ